MILAYVTYDNRTLIWLQPDSVSLWFIPSADADMSWVRTRVNFFAADLYACFDWLVGIKIGNSYTSLVFSEMWKWWDPS